MEVPSGDAEVLLRFVEVQDVSGAVGDSVSTVKKKNGGRDARRTAGRRRYSCGATFWRLRIRLSIRRQNLHERQLLPAPDARLSTDQGVGIDDLKVVRESLRFLRETLVAAAISLAALLSGTETRFPRAINERCNGKRPLALVGIQIGLRELAWPAVGSRNGQITISREIQVADHGGG